MSLFELRMLRDEKIIFPGRTCILNHTRNSSTTVCPLVQGGNPRALARGLPPVQADKRGITFYITHISVGLFRMKYFVLNFAISG